MNQKVFIQKSDEILDSMSAEELRSCLHNIARSTPENKREKFLQLLDDCCHQNEQKENSVFETEVSVQKAEEIFWNIFCLWKVNYAITVDDIKSYVEWLESVIDKRIDGIVGGKYRNKYNDVALLAAALGEVKESLGMKMAKRIVINRYLERYSRHSAFRGALKEYMD